MSSVTPHFAIAYFDGQIVLFTRDNNGLWRENFSGELGETLAYLGEAQIDTSNAVLWVTPEQRITELENQALALGITPVASAVLEIDGAPDDTSYRPIEPQISTHVVAPEYPVASNPAPKAKRQNEWYSIVASALTGVFLGLSAGILSDRAPSHGADILENSKVFETIETTNKSEALSEIETIRIIDGLPAIKVPSRIAEIDAIAEDLRTRPSFVRNGIPNFTIKSRSAEFAQRAANFIAAQPRIIDGAPDVLPPVRKETHIKYAAVMAAALSGATRDDPIFSDVDRNTLVQLASLLDQNQSQVISPLVPRNVAIPDNRPLDLTSPSAKPTPAPNQSTTRSEAAAPPPAPTSLEAVENATSEGDKPAPLTRTPTRTVTAAGATYHNAIPLNDIALLGVIGARANPTAMIRTPRGGVYMLKVGQIVEGWQIRAIGGREIIIENGARRERLSLPSG